jgi:uncharacterized protein YcfJ
MEFDVLAFILGCVLGAIVGWRVCNQFHTSMIADILKAAGVGEGDLRRAINNLQAEEGEEELPRVEVRIEEVDGGLYAYRIDTQEFLGQGTDQTTLIDRIKEVNKSNFILVVSQSNGADLLKPTEP